MGKCAWRLDDLWVIGLKAREMIVFRVDGLEAPQRGDAVGAEGHGEAKQEEC